MEKLTRIFGSIVSTFFTTANGVTLSEVTRIQAEHKQQNDKFWSDVADAVAGIFQKVITYLGSGEASRTIKTSTITADKIGEYVGVAERNALNSTLMHAVKLYKYLQAELVASDLRLHVAESLPVAPIHPLPAKRGSICGTEKFMELSNIDEMIAVLNPDVLAKFDLAFWKKANELNSRAAVLGKLLSKQGSFFRELVEPLPKGGEQVTQNGVVITLWERSYSDGYLGQFAKLREKLQEEYNDLQKQLNGCRKQIKDVVRAYNLDAERQYQVVYGSYKVEAERHALEMERIRSVAETLRQEALQELAGLKVRVE